MIALLILACIGAYFGIGSAAAAYAMRVYDHLKVRFPERSNWNDAGQPDPGTRTGIGILTVFLWPLVCWPFLAWHWYSIIRDREEQHP